MLINGQRYNNTVDGSITLGTALSVERSEKQLRCAYRKYYIVCIITVSHSEFCADKKTGDGSMIFYGKL